MLGNSEDTILGKLQLEVLNLAYEGNGEETGPTQDYSERNFEIHSTNTSSRGFVRCCIVPGEAIWAGQPPRMCGSGASVAWYAVITYVSDILDTSFRLVVG